MQLTMIGLGMSMQTCRLTVKMQLSRACKTCVCDHDAAPPVQCFQTTSPTRAPPLGTPLAPSICLLVCCLMELWLAAQTLHVYQTA